MLIGNRVSNGEMLSKLLLAWCLMALCVIIHATGVTTLLQWGRRRADPGLQWWPAMWMFIRLAWMIILLHLIEIAVWAILYAWTGAMPGLQAAVYFSAVTYTTTGYGDLVLPGEWRLVGAVEALSGILMCAWSTGFFVAAVSRTYQPDTSRRAS